MQVMYDRGFIQVGEFSHIVGLVELGRIDLIDLVRIDLALL